MSPISLVAWPFLILFGALPMLAILALFLGVAFAPVASLSCALSARRRGLSRGRYATIGAPPAPLDLPRGEAAT